MTVDIYVREKNGSREIRFPILPERINYTSGDTVFVTYEIMNRGDVAVPSGTGLSGIGWESEFPGSGRRNDPMIRGTWKSPKYFHNILKDWAEHGTTLNILVVGYPFNFDVHLATYKAEPYGGFGDMAYEISFQEAREITVKTTKVTTSSSTKRPAKKTTAYTIKSGDTLWEIAEKFLGSGAKWTTIYNANKNIIESTARNYGRSSSDNGHWIYPGVKLTIPKS